MITYLKITFSSEGAKPKEVVDRLSTLGFKPTHGNYDFMYEWDKKAGVKDAVWFADKVHATLEGMNVLFQIETHGINSG